MALLLKDRKVLVLGLGETGLSMTRWLARRGASVRVADSRAAPPHAAALAAELPDVPLAARPFADEDFVDAELIAISPGLDRRLPPIARALARGTPVVGDIELFAQELNSLTAQRTALNAPKVLAITGSNGKSTVTAMAGEMCRAAGRATVVAGNIGVPVLDALAAVEGDAKLPEVFVLELSSFQLESTTSLQPDAATVLNLSEDHLDRYDGMAEYAAAKARIFAGEGVQVLNRDDERSMAMARHGRTVVSFGLDEPHAAGQWGIRALAGGSALANGSRNLMPLQALPVAGLHNAANTLAALALARAIDLPEPPLLDALRSFKGLPHRLQRVAEFGGVTFYDDSKGTNVGASVAALNGMTQPVALIAGGEGKGQDFSPLAAAASRRARAVVLIGRDAPTIARAFSGGNCRLVHAVNMEEAVRLAWQACRAGDAVLLSPACASFDMFRSYVHRGEAFVEAVRKLIAEAAR